MNVVIIGATQGLGRALAGLYLERGHCVCVCGRDLTKLESWPYNNSPRLSRFQLDITQAGQTAQLFELYREKNIDLLINCAGSYVNNRTQQLNPEESLALLNSNVLALNQLMTLAAQKMLSQQSGHIVALSSVAALIHYPGASLYSATKRSVINLCDTYRTALAPFSIQVTAVIPGYINTAELRRLNAGDASDKLFIVEEDYAAKLIVQQLDRRVAQLIFPKRMRYLMAFLSLLPRVVLSYFLRQAPGRKDNQKE